MSRTSFSPSDWLLLPSGIMFEFDLRKDENPVEIQNTSNNVSLEEQIMNLANINENINESQLINSTLRQLLCETISLKETVTEYMQKPNTIINNQGVVQTISGNSIEQGSSLNAPITTNAGKSFSFRAFLP